MSMIPTLRDALLGIFLLSVLVGSGFAQTRVAFLGDSITAGQGSGSTREEIAHARFPAVVARLLGSEFEVQGFGAHGHSLRTDVKQVYANSKAFGRGLAFKPEIAVIMLGTNDSAIEEPMEDWRGCVERLLVPLRAASPGVRVLLASPPEMFPGAEGIKDDRREWLTARRPRLHAIAESLYLVSLELDDVEFVDVRSVLRSRDVTDGVHLNAFGSERLAYRFAGAIEMRADGTMDRFREVRATLDAVLDFTEEGTKLRELGTVEARMRTMLVEAGIHTAESEPATTPIPSAEYRGASAGWGGGTWRTAFASLQALAQAAKSEPPMDVVFFGDSITQGLTGHSARIAQPEGMRAIDVAQAGRRAVSLGLSGDRTEHLLYRIAEGSLDGFRPRVIVLQIGVNNINAAGHTGEETYRGIVRVVEALRQRLPDTKILIAGPFPAGLEAKGRVRQSVARVHELLAEHAFDGAVTYQNLEAVFVNESGAPLPTLGSDGIHISPVGQQAWMNAIEPTLARLLDGVPVTATGK